MPVVRLVDWAREVRNPLDVRKSSLELLRCESDPVSSFTQGKDWKNWRMCAQRAPPVTKYYGASSAESLQNTTRHLSYESSIRESVHAQRSSCTTVQVVVRMTVLKCYLRGHGAASEA